MVGMTTTVTPLTPVGNQERRAKTLSRYSGSRIEQFDGVSTLAERIIWVLGTGRIGGAREWSRAAGLSSSHVSTFLFRAKRSPRADLERGVVEALALSANVDPGWLLTGDGAAEPSAPRAGDDDPVPERARAIVAACALHFEEEAIAHVRRKPLPMGPEPFTDRDWFDEMREADRRVRKGIPLDEPTFKRLV